MNAKIDLTEDWGPLPSKSKCRKSTQVGLSKKWKLMFELSVSSSQSPTFAGSYFHDGMVMSVFWHALLPQAHSSQPVVISTTFNQKRQVLVEVCSDFISRIHALVECVSLITKFSLLQVFTQVSIAWTLFPQWINSGRGICVTFLWWPLHPHSMVESHRKTKQFKDQCSNYVSWVCLWQVFATSMRLWIHGRHLYTVASRSVSVSDKRWPSCWFGMA